MRNDVILRAQPEESAFPVIEKQILRFAQNDRQPGFTYLTVLFVVAIMGLGLAVTGEVWHTAVARDREAELLYVGNQYRRAIERYYVSGPKQYPRVLEDLLKDPRKPGTERYLRKLYNDPVTGKSEWGIVKAPDGGIMGVYSGSEDKPWKTSGFSIFNKEFEGAAKYSDWKFLYTPAGAQVPLQPSQQPGAPLQQVPLQSGQQPGAPLPQLPLQQPGMPGQR
jgi:type II secretory pathway pseudopilin PulG